MSLDTNMPLAEEVAAGLLPRNAGTDLELDDVSDAQVCAHPQTLA